MRCWAVPPLVLLARAVARLPQGVLLALSRGLAWLTWPLLASRRRVAAVNLALCFPQLDARARQRLLASNMRETVMGVFELLRAWYAPDHALAGCARIDGLQNLQQALARGQGVLLFTGHFTQTELAARLLTEALGRRVGGVVRHHNAACVQSALEQARAGVFGATLEKKDVRGLLRALRGGEVMVYSADQNFTYQHAFVPFFGVPAATLTSTPELVRRGNAQMLPFWFHREADGSYRLSIEPAWPGWNEGDGAQAAAIYMRELERVVRAHPAQYLWVHRRFKTRPPGEPAVYR